ncbi:branched-chain amino acid ABC transporter permease [Pandoraea anhela]|uniref:ABC transporter permease n=1 Tax=Pandoraea anhela TaxID=2508295 RepID=A0A5E4Z1J4_9BURK|nr:branched-chain amino acid ABC transporter permease [Pandoraea anhela]VVE55009.1 ABC transporter permease [Pandoraea anhela]
MMRRYPFDLVLLLVLLALPALGVYPVFAMKVLCFALFACSLNLVLGYTGLLSFGHAAFFGGAAYFAGYAMRDFAWSPLIGLLIGVATGAVFGWLFGLFAIRRQGIYFAMITLAFAQMFYFFCLQAPFTGGEDGLQGVPRRTLMGVSLDRDLTLYYVVLAVVAAAFVLITRVISSPFGRVLAAIKENEPRAISLGYEADRFKLLAFVLSAAIAGLAGALKTLVLGFATLSDVHWLLSGSVILMTLVGGLGTRFGPVVGALLIVSLETKLGDFGNWLSQATGWQPFSGLGSMISVLTGVIFVLCVLMFRRGIVGEWLAWRMRWATRQR